MIDATPEDPGVYYQAASYYFSADKDLDQALDLMEGYRLIKNDGERGVDKIITGKPGKRIRAGHLEIQSFTQGLAYLPKGGGEGVSANFLFGAHKSGYLYAPYFAYRRGFCMLMLGC